MSTPPRRTPFAAGDTLVEGEAARGAVMAYEIWDVESANLVGSYATEGAALAAVRDAVRLTDESAALGWALAREDRRGTTTTIASGRNLLDRAALWQASAAG